MKKVDSRRPPPQAERYEGRRRTVNAFLAALGGTLVAKAALQPVDTCKTVMQTSGKGLIQVVSELGRGGLRPFYRGMVPTWIGAMPAQGVYMATYEAARHAIGQLCPASGRAPLVGVAIAASIGNIVAGFIRAPLEVIKQRLQVGSFGGSKQVVAQLLRSTGSLGPGYLSQIARDVPYAQVLMVSYEILREKPMPHSGRPLSKVWVGAFAGAMATFATAPMDLVKSRIMADITYQTCGPVHAMRKVVAQEGLAALWSGSTVRLVHKIPANAIFFAVYELLLLSLEAGSDANTRP